MANKIDKKEEKKTTSKSNSTKKATAKKTSTTIKSTPKKTTTKKTSNTPKKTTDAKKKNSVKKNTNTQNNNNFEKTIIIENIEHEIEKIVDNNTKQERLEEQIVSEINDKDVAKLEEAKFKVKKKDKKLLAIGVIISLLGIIALVITLIANRIVDREFISDNAISLMVIASILIECFGAFIIINES